MSCPKCTRTFVTAPELARHLLAEHGFTGDEALAAAGRIESEGKKVGRQGQGGGPANHSGRCGYCKQPNGQHSGSCPKASEPESSVMTRWTCTACGEKGHTSRSKACPKRATKGHAKPATPRNGVERPATSRNGHADPLKDMLAQRITEKRAELAKLEAAMEALA